MSVSPARPTAAVPVVAADTAVAVKPSVDGMFGQHRGNELDAMRPRFPVLWAAWRTHLLVERQASPVTVATYRRICWDFAAFLEPKPWHKAGPRDLANFIARPAPGSRTGTRAANTQLQIAAAVRGLYRFAHLQGWTATDRMAAFTPPRGGQPRPRGFDQDELRQIITAAEHDPRLHLLCWLGYDAGLGPFRTDAYRAAARRLHPDAGGDHAQFLRLQEAMHVLDEHGARP